MDISAQIVRIDCVSRLYTFLQKILIWILTNDEWKTRFFELTANQRSNSESIDENIIATFAAGEEFGDDVDIRIDCSTGIQHVLQ